jgi:hypothetical protein
MNSKSEVQTQNPETETNNTLAGWEEVLTKAKTVHDRASLGEMATDPTKLVNVLDEIQSLVEEQRDVLKAMSL